MSKILKNCPFIGTFSATGRPYWTKKELRNNPHIGLINHVVYKDHFKSASEYFYTAPTKKSNCGNIVLPVNPTIFLDMGKKMLES